MELEGAIGHAAPLAQEGDQLIYYRDEVHFVFSLPGRCVCVCLRDSIIA